MNRLAILLFALAVPALAQIQIGQGGVLQVGGGSGAPPNNLNIVNVGDYGCAGDGVTDDTTCAVNAAGAVITAAATGPVTFYWPAGTYVLDPLSGMVPFTTGATSNTFFQFTGLNNVTVEGHSATLQMKTPTTPYNQQVAIASGATYLFNWFDFIGGNHNTVTGLTIDNHGNAYGANACVQSISGTPYGCFWGNGVRVDGGTTLQASITQTSLAGGVATYTWASLVGGSAPSVGAPVSIRGTTNAAGQLDTIAGTVLAITGTTSGTFTVRLNISSTLSASAQAESGATATFNQPRDFRIINNRFLDLEGWPAIAFNVADVLIYGNYVEHSEGMVCANGSIYCTISHNTSIDARDAHFGLNGGRTAEQAVSYSVVSDNIGTRNNNGSGIDVTAARHATITGNNISWNQNWCILVDRSDGPYSTAEAAVIPSSDVSVASNTCHKNLQYGGWPIGAEIMVGDQYVSYTGGTFTPGTAASYVHVTGNTVTAQNPYGSGVGVGYGAAHVSIDGNNITGCSASSCITTLVERVSVWSATNQASDVSISGNTSDSTYTNFVRLEGTIDNLHIGDNAGWQVSMANGAAVTTQPQTQMIGEYYLTDSSTGSFVTPFQFYAPSSTGTQNVRLFFGHDGSTNNAASVKWYGAGGLGSASNEACLGLYSNEFGLCVDGNLNLYRGTFVIIPNTVTGFHGSGGTAVQLSDGTGASGHYAKFDSTGKVTDGGVGTGTPTSTWTTDTGGSNTTGAFTCGTGCSFAPAGSGTVQANSFTGNITESQVTSLNSDLAAKVSATRTINGYDLTANRTLVYSDIAPGTVSYTGSTTGVLSDNGKVVKMSCSAPCTYTLPATQPAATWQVTIISLGAAQATVLIGGADTYNAGTTPPVLPAVIWANSGVATGYMGYSIATSGTAPSDLGALTYNASGTTTFPAAAAANAAAVVTATHSTSTAFSPTGLVKWGSYMAEIKQDGTGGGVTFTLGTSGSCTAWIVGGGGGGAITLSASANAVDLLTWTYDGANCVANFRQLFN